jgi:hypothetical protein
MIRSLALILSATCLWAVDPTPELTPLPKAGSTTIPDGASTLSLWPVDGTVHLAIGGHSQALPSDEDLRGIAGEGLRALVAQHRTGNAALVLAVDQSIPYERVAAVMMALTEGEEPTIRYLLAGADGRAVPMVLPVGDASKLVVEEPVITEIELPVEEIIIEDEDVTETTNGSPTVALPPYPTSGPQGFSQRYGGGKKRALGQYGGSRASEAAVHTALQFLQRHQSPDGNWDVDNYYANCEEDGPRCEPGESHHGLDGDIGVTALALSCFLGSGYDHRTPNRFRRTVKDGIDWLLEQVHEDERFGKGRNYELALAVMALSEAYGMTDDPELKDKTQFLIDMLRERQAVAEDEALGWDYVKPKAARIDTSVSGWAVQALYAAKGAGFDVGTGLESKWVTKAWWAANNGDEGPAFPYTWNSTENTARKTDRVEIGAGISALLLPSEDACRLRLAAAIAPGDAEKTWPTDLYRLHYGSIGAFHAGGVIWRDWNDQVRDLLIRNQRKDDGCFAGSWDWQGTEYHGHTTGRLLSTALACLNLEVYYRYQPNRSEFSRLPKMHSVFKGTPVETADPEEWAPVVNIILTPAGLKRGGQVSAYQAQWEAMQAPVPVSLRIGNNKPHAVTMDALTAPIHTELAPYETPGPRSDQMEVLVHSFAHLPWSWMLTSLAAVEAYEAARSSRAPGLDNENSRRVNIAPPRMGNYHAWVEGNELFELLHLK